MSLTGSKSLQSLVSCRESKVVSSFQYPRQCLSLYVILWRRCPVFGGLL